MIRCAGEAGISAVLAAFVRDFGVLKRRSWDDMTMDLRYEHSFLMMRCLWQSFKKSM